MAHANKKIIRAATIGASLNTFCFGLLKELQDKGYQVLALSSPDEKLHELCIREQVRTIGVPMERHIAPLKDFVSLFRLIRVFLNEKPDMVHSMTPKAGLLCFMDSKGSCTCSYFYRIGIPNVERFDSKSFDGYRLVDLCLCYPCDS